MHAVLAGKRHVDEYIYLDERWGYCRYSLFVLKKMTHVSARCPRTVAPTVTAGLWKMQKHLHRALQIHLPNNSSRSLHRNRIPGFVAIKGDANICACSEPAATPFAEILRLFPAVPYRKSKILPKSIPNRFKS
jgi:hypothetical protein